MPCICIIKKVVSNHLIPLGLETDLQDIHISLQKTMKKRRVYLNQPA